MKTEIRSWADVAKKNTNDQSIAVSVKRVKDAVKTAVAEDDRSKRFMIFGLSEAEEGEVDDLVHVVEASFEKTGAVPFPVIYSAYRLREKNRLSPSRKGLVDLYESCSVCFKCSIQT